MFHDFVRLLQPVENETLTIPCPLELFHRPNFVP